MAFVLNTPIGVEERVLIFLSVAKNLLQTSPFTIAQAKADIEASQSITFSDTAWRKMLQAVYALELDYSQMTAAEKDMMNKIVEYISPAPFLQNCSDNDPEAGGITLVLTQDFNTTASYAMELTFDNPYKCSILTVDVAQTAGTLTPTNIPTLSLRGAINGKNTYTGLWLVFSETPTGTYSFDFTFKDVDDNQVGTIINKSITL